MKKAGLILALLLVVGLVGMTGCTQTEDEHGTTDAVFTFNDGEYQVATPDTWSEADDFATAEYAITDGEGGYVYFYDITDECEKDGVLNDIDYYAEEAGTEVTDQEDITIGTMTGYQYFYTTYYADKDEVAAVGVDTVVDAGDAIIQINGYYEDVDELTDDQQTTLVDIAGSFTVNE